MSHDKTVEFDLRGMGLVVVVGAWLVGILISSWVMLPALGLLMGACAALLLLIPLWRDPLSRVVMLSVLWLLLGMWRYTVASPIGDPQAISNFIGTNKVEVQGAVSDEPKLQGSSRVLLIAVSSLSRNNGTSWQNADGQLEVQTLGGEIDDPYGANYGDNVELQGKLQPPSPYTPVGVFANMIFPRITVSSNGGNPIIAVLYHLRVALANIIAQSLPQPEAALMIAILLGLHTPALNVLASFFKNTGTIHLTVSSGFKVTVLAGLVLASTRWLYAKRNASTTPLLPAQKDGKKSMRWLATTMVVACIAIYTVLSGAGPAALRAGIMGILLIIAPRLGRYYNINTALALAAFLMSLLNPFVLWDVGFLLSFLGTIGIVYLTPLIQRLFLPLERLPFGHTLVEIGAVTLAAQIATLPIVAVTFNTISFISPFANILSVPLLGIMILLGLLICGAGLLFAPLGILFGWIAWPILWYVATIVKWCSNLPGAYIPYVSNLNSGLVWGYYGLLALLISFTLTKWPHLQQAQHSNASHGTHPSFLSRRILRLLQVGAAVLILLATGTAALANHANGQLTITFLNVGPANQIAQGEAVLIRTPDGKTALIDGGLDATSLSQQLDSRLPPWQRSLDMVILTDPRTDHLTGLQDIVGRYQIGTVIDAGMLHPNTGYALWRSTIAARNLHYMQVRQGATIMLGLQVTLQIFSPPSPLHKGSDEELDNGLLFRLSTPNFKMLFIGATAMSKYALTELLSTIAPSYLQADIVQVVAEAGKDFPAALGTILQEVKPSYVVITPAGLSAKQRKAGTSPIITLPSVLTQLKAQVEQTAQVGTLEISDDSSGWNVHSA
ncbi:MAG: ComEC/Rec2 family competence protein [Ktedonobacteraceae bacterium]